MSGELTVSGLMAPEQEALIWPLQCLIRWCSAPELQIRNDQQFAKKEPDPPHNVGDTNVLVPSIVCRQNRLLCYYPILSLD